MVKSYLVTIKPNLYRYTSILDLQLALASARELYHKADWHSEVGYELDSFHRMHLHTVVKFPTNISMQRYARQYESLSNNMRIHFMPIKKDDVDHVIGYCTKEKSPSIMEEESKEHFLMRKLKLINVFKLLKDDTPTTGVGGQTECPSNEGCNPLGSEL